uniref:Thioredoxin like 4A n=1 Tax=Apteryx owenii TaxID=8824 RepID=A0A8B9SFP7_APTOW
MPPRRLGTVRDIMLFPHPPRFWDLVCAKDPAPPLRAEARFTPPPSGSVPGRANAFRHFRSFCCSRRRRRRSGAPSSCRAKDAPGARHPPFRMSYMLPHLHNGWQVDQAILSEEDRVVVIRFGHDWDPTCMKMDEVLYSIAEKKWHIKGGDPSSSSCLQAMFGSRSCFKELYLVWNTAKVG